MRLTCANFVDYGGIVGAKTYAYFYANNNIYITGFDNSHATETFAINFGSGFSARGGDILTYQVTSPTNFSLQGYLAPSTAVPAAGTAAAAESMIEVGGRPIKEKR